MGNSQPINKTGKKVVVQKLENASRTGILSLQEHGLEEVPKQVYGLSKLRSLDLSRNALSDLGGGSIGHLQGLKVLAVESNKLGPGSLGGVSGLTKLHTLNAGKNQLGPSLPPLPSSLKTLRLHQNNLLSVPPQICSFTLTKLENLDLSNNALASVPSAIRVLVGLVELNLDNNTIPSLPTEIGELKKLKVLSLRSNGMDGATKPQPLPPSLFADTQLIDLNLHENNMRNTQLMDFTGFDAFLERRKKVKSVGITGGALIDLDTCGLR